MEKRNLIPSHLSVYSPPIFHSNREYATPFTPQDRKPHSGRTFRAHSVHSIDHYYSKPIQILGPRPKSLSDLKDSSEFVLCPNCGKHVFTKVESRAARGVPRVVVVIISILFCLIGFWVCIPLLFVFPRNRSVGGIGHICPRCDGLIYRFNETHANGT